MDKTVKGLQLRRICSSHEVLERRLCDLTGFLVERGYDHDFVDTKFVRISDHDRADLLESKNKLKNKDSFGDRVCSVVDYHGLSSEFPQVLKEKPLLSRPRNLKIHLQLDLNCVEKGNGMYKDLL